MRLELGKKMMKKEQLDTAYELFRETYEIKYNKLKTDNDIAILDIMDLIIHVLTKMGKFHDVMQWLDKYLKAKEAIYGNFSCEIFDIYVKIGYQQLQIFKDSTAALFSFEKALEIAKKLNLI